MKRVAILLSALLLFAVSPFSAVAERETAAIAACEAAAPYVTDDELSALLQEFTDTAAGELREVSLLYISAAEGWKPGAQAEYIAQDCHLYSLAKGESAASESLKRCAVDAYGDSLPLTAIDPFCAGHPMLSGPDEASECNSREFRLRLYAAEESPVSSYTRVMLYQLDSIIACGEASPEIALPFPISVEDALTPYVQAADMQSLQRALKGMSGDEDEIQSVSVVKIDLAASLPFCAEDGIDDLFLLSVAKGAVPSQEDIQRTGVSYPFCGPGKDSPCNSREYRAHLLSGASASNGEALMMLYQIDRIIDAADETVSSGD